MTDFNINESGQFTGAEVVTYNNTGGGIGDSIQVGDFQIGACDFYPYWNNQICNWYPSISYVTEKSKVEQAFKIIGVLIDKKIISGLNVKKFIELVNDIAKLL